MAINPSQFHTLNVADTCSIWNVLSSDRLYAAAREAGCSFCCTEFVIYECLYKRRSNNIPEERELMLRLQRENAEKRIVAYSLDIADLQAVAILENRRRLSKGELSSIAFAQKTGQSFLTDDKNARKLAESFLPNGMTQTTPHLFGWLIFTCKLTDSDKAIVTGQHEEFRRPLRRYFEHMYLEALRCRLHTTSARPKD